MMHRSVGLPSFFNEFVRGVHRLWCGTPVALSAAPVTRRDETMDGIRKQLEQDLRAAVARLRQLGGATALEDLLGPRGEHWSFADEVDEIQANERREIGFATRELLVDRVNRITAALERLDEGEYGVCVECGEQIAAAR